MQMRKLPICGTSLPGSLGIRGFLWHHQLQCPPSHMRMYGKCKNLACFKWLMLCKRGCCHRRQRQSCTVQMISCLSQPGTAPALALIQCTCMHCVAA